MSQKILDELIALGVSAGTLHAIGCALADAEILAQRRAADRRRWQAHVKKTEQNQSSPNVSSREEKIVEQNQQPANVSTNVSSREAEIPQQIQTTTNVRADESTTSFLRSSSLTSSSRVPTSEPRARARRQGTKLPDDWTPPDKLREYAIELGYSTPQYQSSIDGMVDWARANANRQVARKADWTATARGWLRREAERLGIKPPPGPATNGYHPPPGAVSVLEIMRKAREDEERTKVRGSAGVGQDGADHAAELPLSGGGLLQGKVDRPQGRPPDDRARH